MAKIAISSSGDQVESPVVHNFGRAPYFALFDESGEVSVYANPGLDAMGGAGVKAAQSVVNSGVNTVITGKVGPRAEDVLKEAGIKVFICHDSLSVKDAFEFYKNGKLQMLF